MIENALAALDNAESRVAGTTDALQTARVAVRAQAIARREGG